MNFEETNILSTVVEDLYGAAFQSYTGSIKCIMKITGEDRLMMTCMMVVNLGDRNQMQQAAKESENDLKKVGKDCLANVKKLFKEKSGRALKTKEVSCDSAVELMNYHAYSEKGTALVRQVHVFEIS
jgi:2,4-dienoyl-CoA reductase-like NADH-dependent reductase (Old Yellow Enzyme family)